MEAYRGQFALIEEYNEEKCRDFLVHELGVEIPRFYRYAEGIHEVQKRIILRYGDENFAKAMGIFTHLLESDDNAAGLGDDGDLWRSWRHDYKLRGEDYANPGTPRFSGLILPAVQPPRRSYTPLVVAAAQNQRFDPESSSNRVNKHDAASGRARDSKEGNSLALATATPASLNIPALAKETVEISMVSSNACPMKGSKTFKAGLRRMVATNLSSLFPTVKEEEDEEDEDKPPPVPPKDNTPPSHNKNPPPPSSPRLPPLCFDGACDMPDFRDDPFSTSSGASDPIDNNRRSIHSLMDHKASERTKRPVDCSFPTSATSSSNLSSAISSATYSTASGKDGFRNLARDLLNTNRSDVSSSMLGNFSALDPAKYSPPASTTTPMDAIDP
ncbi:MAG: hypothetical protein M1832_003616 [Thelocarpon impressellum]|nr:MAG: hypothetical protein M1832_003616 [Thelocarpon impressellum]